jgi:hypothetical protein
MIVSDQQVLAAQDEFWNELRRWRLLPLRDGEVKALRDRHLPADEDTQPQWMDQPSEEQARFYIQFRSLKAALCSINLDECPSSTNGAEPGDSPPSS